jgi:hypothetical protein
MNESPNPFEEQLKTNLEARRAAPTANTIRIGDGAAPTDTAPVDTAPVKQSSRERPPLPVLIGSAMAVGALCVVGASLIFRQIVPATKPVYPTNSITTPGTVVMENPSLVLREPQANDVTENEAAPPDETPSVEISELPTLAPQPTAKPDEKKPEEEPRATTTPENQPTQAYSGRGFEITPPPGFSLRREGRRTIWQREDGAQILVETGKAGDGSPRVGWEKLSRDLKKRYGDRYRSLGIREGTLDGKPAAIWEFELTGKDGITRRKIDIGIKHEGRGYAILGSAPKDKFDATLPDLQNAINTFRTAPNAQPQPTATRQREQTEPLKESPASLPEATAAPTIAPTATPRERGY